MTMRKSVTDGIVRGQFACLADEHNGDFIPHLESETVNAADQLLAGTVVIELALA